jgi:hypothetical protein
MYSNFALDALTQPQVFKKKVWLWVSKLSLSLISFLLIFSFCTRVVKMGQGQAKKAVRNRQRAVVAGPPLGIEGGDFVKVKVSSGTEEESNLNDAIRAFPIGAKEYCGLEVDPKHLVFAIIIFWFCFPVLKLLFSGISDCPTLCETGTEGRVTDNSFYRDAGMLEGQNG